MTEIQRLAHKAFRKYQMKCFDAKQEYERELSKIELLELESV